MDGSGVVQTGVQELLLQSHPEEPSTDLFGGGPIRKCPGVPSHWKVRFRLHARGGSVVEAESADGRVTQATATSSRGGVFRWIDPADGTVKTRQMNVPFRGSLAFCRVLARGESCVAAEERGEDGGGRKAALSGDG